MQSNQSQKQKRVSYVISFTKIFFLIILASLCLEVTMVLFQWNTVEQLPLFLRPYSDWLLSVNPYLRYINSGIILVLGYIIVNELGSVTYFYMRGFADHSSSATIEKIVKIVGFGVIISVLVTVLSFDPSAALTFGSLTGLILGFATQTFLSNALAGVFILITRPFTFGDIVTIQTNTGVVKELRILHLVLETVDRTKEVMIPNNLVMSQVIQKDLPGKKMGPIPTKIIIYKPPEKLKIGETAIFMGQLIQSETRKPLSNATVKLLESDIGRDELLRVGVTNTEGKFEIDWKVRKVDRFDDFAELYTKFDGDDEHRSTSSKKYNVQII